MTYLKVDYMKNGSMDSSCFLNLFIFRVYISLLKGELTNRWIYKFQ